MFRLFLSVAAGFIMMFVVMKLFDAMEWKFFNSFAVAHGTFIILCPLCFGIGAAIFHKHGRKSQ